MESYIVSSICNWNEVRDNRNFDGQLEFDMLQEELTEYAHAYLKTISDKFPKETLKFRPNGEIEPEDLKMIDEYMLSEEGTTEYKVNQLDALADIIFVAVGSMYKLLGNADLTESVLDAVIAANNRKGTEKDANGKVQKPEDFVGPEEDIKELYLDRVTLV